MKYLLKLKTQLLIFSFSFIALAQEANDSIEIPGEKMVDQNESFRSEMYPLMIIVVLLVLLLVVFLVMRNTGKNRRNNYRKTFNNN